MERVGVHFQETVWNVQAAFYQALQHMGLGIPRKPGAQGPDIVPLTEITAETEKYVPGDPKYGETQKAEKRDEAEGGKVMLNSLQDIR